MKRASLEPLTGTFPRIIATGGVAERGESYGRQARTQVQGSLALYEEAYRAIADLEWGQAVDRAKRFEGAIESEQPDVLAEMEAIARGAGAELDDILALNLRTEILFTAHSRRLLPGECTTCASSRPARDGRRSEKVIGQNWDWKRGAIDTVVIIEYPDSKVGGMLTVVEAGLVAKSGLNAAGLGVVFNSLVCDEDRTADQGEPGGLPMHVLIRAAFDCESAHEAADLVKGAHRTTSGNLMFADREGTIVNLEMAPGSESRTWISRLDQGEFVHANHFISGRNEVVDAGPQFAPDSLNRQTRGEAIVADWKAGGAVEQMQAMLRDHRGAPESICAHPDESLPWIEQDATVASMVFDLEELEALIATGPPCGSKYLSYRLGDS